MANRRRTEAVMYEHNVTLALMPAMLVNQVRRDQELGREISAHLKHYASSATQQSIMQAYRGVAEVGLTSLGPWDEYLSSVKHMVISHLGVVWSHYQEPLNNLLEVFRVAAMKI